MDYVFFFELSSESCPTYRQHKDDQLCIRKIKLIQDGLVNLYWISMNKYNEVLNNIVH